ncbi:hypothetical protein LJ739_08945 [Aestuariibacter halophilus]|uniref:SURF1-like protein n=1 Tax=Fluctibacter halophilus TaxID=226011 RepID=A0ABS8G970_9ALTE|nr:hypothetical protein [Aestuariibacter halophilus]MCC2616365.1 hypothetical protein [Aestuariibacter halophilus]
MSATQVREGYISLNVNNKNSMYERLTLLPKQHNAVITYTYPLHQQDLAFVSGLPDGEYQPVLQAKDGSTQSLPPFTVKHYPLWQAGGLFILGLAVFVALLVTLFNYQRSED